MANYELRTTMTNEQNKNTNEEIINKYLDNEGDCERCGCNMCEEDWEHNTREIFVSNVDGKNICRRCVREEDEEEDKEKCEECGEECPHPAVIKKTGPSHRVVYCRSCFFKVEKKNCRKCEKPTTNDELILCDGVCRKCDQKGK